jgi:hypothetical protein
VTDPEREPSWPPLPQSLRADPKAQEAWATAVATAIVEAEKSARAVDADRAKEAADLNQKLTDTLATISIGGIERARGGAQFVQTASTALAGLYTGVLGVLFVADQPAPVRSLIPALFLGLAVVLATYYLAFVVPGTNMDRPEFQNIPAEDLWERLNYISLWVRQVVFRRAGALRAAVVSLFFGLVFLPIGLASVPTDWSLPLLPASTATPSAIDWPSPTVLPDPALSVALYTAQLDQFRKGLTQAPTAAASRDDIVAWLLALAAVVIVGVVWNDPLRLWTPSEAKQVRPRA